MSGGCPSGDGDLAKVRGGEVSAKAEQTIGGDLAAMKAAVLETWNSEN